MSFLQCQSLPPTVRCHGEGRLGKKYETCPGRASSYNRDRLLSSALPLVCTAVTHYINCPVPSLCHERKRKFSKARPKNKTALYVLGVLTSTQMTHFSISKGLRDGWKKRGSRGGGWSRESKAGYTSCWISLPLRGERLAVICFSISLLLRSC